MKRVPLLAIAFALLTLHLSLTYTGSIGWYHHLEWTSDYDYMLMARNMMQGQGYSSARVISDHPDQTAYRTPTYPLFLFVAFTAFDNSEPATRMLQSVLTAMIVFLTVTLAWWLGGSIAGIVAGLALIVNINLYIYAANLMSETMFAFLCIVFTVLFVQRRWRLAGVAFLVFTFTHGTLVLALPMLMVFTWRQRALLRFALPVLALIGIWTARNAAVMHAFIPMTTGAGAVLYGADNAIAFGQASGQWVDPSLVPGNKALLGGGEVAQDARLREAALAYLRSAPIGLVVINTIAKIMAFFGLFEAASTKWTVLAAFGSLLASLSLRALRTRRSSGAATGSGFR